MNCTAPAGVTAWLRCVSAAARGSRPYSNVFDPRPDARSIHRPGTLKNGGSLQFRLGHSERRSSLLKPLVARGEGHLGCTSRRDQCYGMPAEMLAELVDPA